MQAAIYLLHTLSLSVDGVQNLLYALCSNIELAKYVHNLHHHKQNTNFIRTVLYIVQSMIRGVIYELAQVYQ